MSDEKFLYISTTGWKTGKLHEIEIWYVEHGGCFYAVSELREKAHWVQNIRHNPHVQLFVGTREEKEEAGGYRFPGTGRALDIRTEADLCHQVSHLMDVKYNWSAGLIVQLCPDNP